MFCYLARGSEKCTGWETKRRADVCKIIGKNVINGGSCLSCITAAFFMSSKGTIVSLTGGEQGSISIRLQDIAAHSTFMVSSKSKASEMCLRVNQLR